MKVAGVVGAPHSCARVPISTPPLPVTLRVRCRWPGKVPGSSKRWASTSKFSSAPADTQGWPCLQGSQGAGWSAEGA